MAGRFKDYIAPAQIRCVLAHCTPLWSGLRASAGADRTATCTGIAATGATKKPRPHGALHPHAAETDDMAWMRQLLDWQREAADPEFLESLAMTFAVQEIFVFTPRRRITLPTGSTPVDSLAAQQYRGGPPLIGARVNGRLVALERKPGTGEVVEVFTSKAPNAGPRRGTAFVVSPARKDVKIQWFAKERGGGVGDQAAMAHGSAPRWTLQRLVIGESMAASRTTRTLALYTAIGEGARVGETRRSG